MSAHQLYTKLVCGYTPLCMEPELKKIVKENLELTKENNRLLRKIRRGSLLGGLMKIIWIAIILGVPVYLYFNFIEPILGDVIDAAQTIQEVGNKVQGVEEQIGGGLDSLREFFNR